MVAATSAATTSLLFVACSVQTNQPASTPSSSSTSTSATAPAPPAAASPKVVNTAASPSAQGGLTVAAPARAQGAQQAAPGTQNPAVSVYQQNGGSVVNITSLAVVTGLGTSQQQQAQPQGIGSGFFIDTDGRIVTNNHVVQDADQLTVTFQDKTTVPARLLGRDPDND